MAKNDSGKLLIIRGDSPMYEDIFHIAYAYNQSSQLINDFSAKQKNAAFMFPSIVCQSFAIELSLKFFLVIDHPEICNRKDFEKFDLKLNKHGFSELWDLINVNYQNEIVRHHTNCIGNESSACRFKKLLEDIGSDSFVRWRYIHELEGFNFMHISDTKQASDVLLSVAYSEMKKRVGGPT